MGGREREREREREFWNTPQPLKFCGTMKGIYATCIYIEADQEHAEEVTNLLAVLAVAFSLVSLELSAGGAAGSKVNQWRH